MALETWLIKLKKTISHSFDSVRATPPAKIPVTKKSRVRMLAFEIAGIMPKLTHINLATSIFTILSRIKLVFGISHGYPTSLPHSLSAPATVNPSDKTSNSWNIASGPLVKSSKHLQNNNISHGFFETNSNILKPSSSTIGAAALSLHYANLIIVMEKMIMSPQLVSFDARDDLYSMLPNSIRSSLRSRLKGIGFSASDPVLAGEWREALGKILGWLSPLAHNMIKWQSERSFEHQNLVPKTNVLLFQTLFFANQEKTEAAITELLVGLNYIWRFEREMNAKALFDWTNFNSFKNPQHIKCKWILYQNSAVELSN